jgi:SAM-dependent methyltransferase
MRAIDRANLYALTHRGHVGDAAFYRKACRGVSSVLELGCGSGRILRVLAQRGRRVVGLERDDALRQLARRAVPEGVAVVGGDMRNFELGERFERILIPYSGFLCLLSRSDALQCLRSVRRHLTSRGRLILDAYAGDAFHQQASADAIGPDELEFVVAIEHSGQRWQVFEKSRWLKRRQRLDVTYVYQQHPGKARLEVAIPQRYWLASQVPALLADAGLDLVSMHGDFDGGRYRSRSSELMVITAAARSPARGTTRPRNTPSTRRR